MSLNIGIIGLPNVGKSTTFNALTASQNAEVASYPFCTIEPNRAVVPVPDDRLTSIGQTAERDRIIHATIEYVDIAGLVEGASRGEGLGNQFLAQIRDVDAVLHVVRCFQDQDVAHVSGDLDPQADISTIQTELALADLEQLERKIERLEGEVKGNSELRPKLELAQKLRAHLDQGNPVSTFETPDSPAMKELDRDLRFLSNKPVIFVANVDEAGLGEDVECVKRIREKAIALESPVIKLCAELESGLFDLVEADRREMLGLAGLEESGLNRVIRSSYELLGLISFFTMNEEEVRAWTITQGTRAPQAAGKVHSDFEKGFIKAEVVSAETFLEYGSLAAVRNAGELRIEGKDYVVQDGDLIYFRSSL
ncbi:MAG: redox-regulated ATPase YchF [Anaerolineales bacterium]